MERSFSTMYLLLQKEADMSFLTLKRIKLYVALFEQLLFKQHFTSGKLSKSIVCEAQILPYLKSFLFHLIFAGFGIPFGLCIVVGNSSCWGLGLQLGNRPLPQHGKWLDRCLLSRVPGVCSQLPYLRLQSLLPGPIASPEVHYTYTFAYLMTCSRYNSYGTLLMQLLLQKLLFSPVYCVFPIFGFCFTIYLVNQTVEHNRCGFLWFTK